VVLCLEWVVVVVVLPHRSRIDDVAFLLSGACRVAVAAIANAALNDHISASEAATGMLAANLVGFGVELLCTALSLASCVLATGLHGREPTLHVPHPTKTAPGLNELLPFGAPPAWTLSPLAQDPLGPKGSFEVPAYATMGMESPNLRLSALKTSSDTLDLAVPVLATPQRALDTPGVVFAPRPTPADTPWTNTPASARFMRTSPHLKTSPRRPADVDGDRVVRRLEFQERTATQPPLPMRMQQAAQPLATASLAAPVYGERRRVEQDPDDVFVTATIYSFGGETTASTAPTKATEQDTAKLWSVLSNEPTVKF